MPGISKSGIDSRGRKYLIVDGKRVAAQDQDKGASDAPKRFIDPINSLMRKWLRSARTPEATKVAIAHLISSKFGLWFGIAAKTSVGKSARLYAARFLKETLKADDPTVPKRKDGSLDYPKFAKQLKELGVEEAPASVSTDDDANILKVVHQYGLDSKQLTKVLKGHSGQAKST